MEGFDPCFLAGGTLIHCGDFRVLAVISLKDKYRMLIEAMTPAEQARRAEEVSHFLAAKAQPQIVNERFLRKTIPMGINLSDASGSADRN